MKQATPVASTYRINVKATSDERFFKVLIVMIYICLFQQFESVEKINYIMPYVQDKLQIRKNLSKKINKHVRTLSPLAGTCFFYLQVVHQNQILLNAH